MKHLNLLTVVFVVLKLLGMIHITWWQVFIPTYIWGAFLIIVNLAIATLGIIHYKKYGRWID